jgi:signal transduction histidine kinase/DNA-binding NarL/FixJ family response regulator
VFHDMIDSAAYMAHGYCLLWLPWLVGIHAVSDVLIFVAYSAIPVAIWIFLRRRRDLELWHLAVLFSAFILLCGLTHLIQAITLWLPVYEFQGWVKVVTAVVSVTTAVLIFPLIPKALAIPSPNQLQAVNAGLKREITSHLETFQALECAKERAEKANQAKSAFLSNMSHELRTPLNAVLGFAQIMNNAPDITEQQMENLAIITRSGEHLLSLINNILDVSKIESGRVLLEESPSELHQIVQEMRSMMFAKAKEKGIRFTVEQSLDFPRYVNVDSGKLRQILINLIGNAIKFTETGGVILQAGVATWGARRSARVRFEVKDNGPGIRAEDMGRLFQPFEQLKNQQTTETGTGLGLTICKQYVKLMGGEIGVTSEVGMGSVFFFEIPVVVLPDEEMPAAPRRGHVIGIEGGQQRHRILIAEDQLENRLLLHKLLEPWGFDLREAANGKEAVEIFEQWRPHLIWMDVRMPVMDGREATQRIKLTEAGAHTKIIALTAHALEEERSAILASGCDDFVRKPYREHEIFDVLTKHLGIRFKYADEDEQASGKLVFELTVDQLCELPPEIADELLKAVELLDAPLILEVISRISDRDQGLGEVLRRMAESRQYKELLKVLDTLAEKRAA